MGLFSRETKQMAKSLGVTAENLPRALAREEQARRDRHAVFTRQQEAIKQAAADRKTRKGR